MNLCFQPLSDPSLSSRSEERTGLAAMILLQYKFYDGSSASGREASRRHDRGRVRKTRIRREGRDILIAHRILSYRRPRHEGSHVTDRAGSIGQQ